MPQKQEGSYLYGGDFCRTYDAIRVLADELPGQRRWRIAYIEDMNERAGTTVCFLAEQRTVRAAGQRFIAAAPNINRKAIYEMRVISRVYTVEEGGDQIDIEIPVNEMWYSIQPMIEDQTARK